MRWWLLLSSVIHVSTTMAQHPAIQQIISGVSADSMVWRMERLTGEVPVDVGQGDQWILSRHKYQPGNAMAAQWLQQEFERMGYTPVVQSFGQLGENVLAAKEGVVHPERKVLVSAHYDCMPSGSTAPGADDDGSGVCAVLEAARVLAGLAFENTIVFALWDEEEQGLVGSAYYAAVAAGNDQEIVAVVHMDAIGYDGDGDGLLRVHARPVGNSMAIKDSVLAVNMGYGLDLPIAVNTPGETYSDHASFWTQGYGAILLIEDFDNDPNPYYHTPNDRLQHLDTAYWRGLTQLAIGTAAAMAVPVGPVRVDGPTREGKLIIRPNPAQDQVEAALPDGARNATGLEVLDALGRRMPVAVERGTGPIWTVDVSGLAPGTYLLRTNGPGGTWTGRLVRRP